MNYEFLILLFYNFCLLKDLVKVVNLQGKLKSSRRQPAELVFDFKIDSIGK